MSEYLTNEHLNVPPQIIARAFDNEPCVLFALAMQSSGRHVNVSGSFPPPSYIGWPLEDAFDYDIDDFERLREAYSRGNKAELVGLYAQLRERPRRFVEMLNSLVKDQNQENSTTE